MVRSRRNRVPDGTFFFTVALQDRRSDALVREIGALRDAWQCAKARVPHELIDDLRRHVDYVHINPVKHGLVTRVVDWPYSSFHRHVREVRLPSDWAGTVGIEMAGER